MNDVSRTTVDVALQGGRLSGSYTGPEIDFQRVTREILLLHYLKVFIS
jgi:hypothetical protein